MKGEVSEYWELLICLLRKSCRPFQKDDCLQLMQYLLKLSVFKWKDKDWQREFVSMVLFRINWRF